MNYFTITERKQKTSELLTEARKLFEVYCYLEENELDKQFPVPKITTRYFKANIEADEELKNISADYLPLEESEYITLRERIILEIEYFLRTGEHLDVENITLCVGSRDRNGRVPGVYWCAGLGKLRFAWYNPVAAGGDLRARQQFNPFNSKLESLDEWLEKGEKEGWIKDGKVLNNN